MAMMKLFANGNVERGISNRCGKDDKLSLRRHSYPDGDQSYFLENLFRKQSIEIPRPVFDQFRARIKMLANDYEHRDQFYSPDQALVRIVFKEKEFFSIRRPLLAGQVIEIHAHISGSDHTVALQLAPEALPGLVEMLYDKLWDHPNDIFDRIIKYHRLFQFTFTETSESMTSGLSLRRDVLAQIDEYVPSLQNKSIQLDLHDKRDSRDLAKSPSPSRSDLKAMKQQKFKPKLGERDSQESYVVDYESLFQSHLQADASNEPKAADDQTKRDRQQGRFVLPIAASDIKTFKKLPIRCELSKEDWMDVRESFLVEQACELYLGFEHMEAIYKSKGQWRVYRFPLYYMRVRLEESGRVLYAHPEASGELFVNHLALATIVESFSDQNQTGYEILSQFFGSLLSQKIETASRLSSFQMSRYLPIDEKVFDRIREILIGLPGENGKGGILGNLNLAGISCDLDTVAIYKAPQAASILRRSLNRDLEQVHNLAHEDANRFYQSLLGQVLNAEMRPAQKKDDNFAERFYIPGYPPKATRKLLERLNHHDLVLLEGPPGTGKTHSIMNLLAHAIASKKRLLIISDQQAAIHALVEKVHNQFIGRDRESPAARNLLKLWNQGVKIIDELPSGTNSFSQWIGMLERMLGTADAREPESNDSDQLAEIGKLDQEIAQLIEQISKKLSEAGKGQIPLTPKYAHPTTEEDIRDLVAFLQLLTSSEPALHEASPDRLKVLRKWLAANENFLQSPLATAYSDMPIEFANLEATLALTNAQLVTVTRLLTEKPRSEHELEGILDAQPEGKFKDAIHNYWTKCFQDGEKNWRWTARKFMSYFCYPASAALQSLKDLLTSQRDMVNAIKELDQAERLARQVQEIRKSLGDKDLPCFTLDLTRRLLNKKEGQDLSIHSMLIDIKLLQKKRDIFLRESFFFQLAEISRKYMQADRKQQTSLMTRVTSLLDALKDCPAHDYGTGASLHRELQDALIQAFPIWICRKQAVSFLFPAKERLFDLVIVDEAGQCRVDDAIPLLFRAKKLMVVGDDKQTVLDKNSVVDDFLFRSFELDEYLSHIQASGMKGGGTNIFSLVKAIKQASVMLDEHYRCPPEIIQYSNQYVYDSDLKIMQWKHPNQASSVVVDYSEQSNPKPTRASKGKFKDIDTELIDRFLEFVATTVKKIEKETGQRINMETDVALCYFLLKNEPYFKEVKTAFLKKLGRGSDVLDGAGAALQGKERDYIFYFWDINKSNLRSFRQGDDPDKRKGELNVLMSRPKVRAYHYLHPEFADLKHETASITDFLWSAWQGQSMKKQKTSLVPRKQRPGPDFRPWQRSSGALMYQMLRQVLGNKYQLPEPVYSVVVGDPHYKVDLVLLNQQQGARSLGLIDLSNFVGDRDQIEDLISYYFQLERAVPGIEPVFVFLHELVLNKSASLEYICSKLQDSPSKKVA